MYINLKYGSSEAMMNYIEIDDHYVLLCNKNSAKVNVIKNQQNNQAILVKDDQKFDVSVKWEENSQKVEQIWNQFEEIGANYFDSPKDLFAMFLTIK